MTDLQKRVLESFKKTGNKTQTARDLNLNRSSVRSALMAAQEHLKKNPVVTEIPKTSIETETTANGKSFITRGADITTLEDALEFSDVDMEQFQVDRYKINSWEVTMGGNKTGTGSPQTFTNYQVSVWLKPKEAQIIGIESLFKKIWDNPLPKVKRFIPKKNADLMCELAIYDHHFGMLAWDEECGDNYDNSIARKLYNRAIDYLIDQVKGHSIEEIVIPIGHDLFHFQNESGTTPMSGNLLDVDGRLEKVWEVVEEAMIRAITRCAQIAPTKVYWIPGNHDPQLSFALCKTLSAAFRKTTHVEIDAKANHRKYHSYGKTLIGMTHGTREKPIDLLGLMLEERPKECGMAVHREWHRGHRHKEQTLICEGSQSHACFIRQLPSLAAQDKYHHYSGYSKAGRAAKGLFFNKDTGFHGEFNAPISALG
jgi:hypothetical protein